LAGHGQRDLREYEVKGDGISRRSYLEIDHYLMISYGGLTPKRIDEELTMGQIEGLLEMCQTQPPSAFQLHKLNGIIEGIVKSFFGDSGDSGKPKPEASEAVTVCAWQNAGIGVGVMWDGLAS